MQTIGVWAIDEPTPIRPPLGSAGARIEIGSFYSEIAPFLGCEELSVEVSSVDGEQSRTWPRCQVIGYGVEGAAKSGPADLILLVLP